eukprot:m.168605 g.168605  ORF g.168605 m.168605 type:complete len:543 (+) comp17220_c0_seq1:1053-2681(+)
MAQVGQGVFVYKVPSDTFYDSLYGFNLTLDLEPEVFPDWLFYEKANITLKGVPTNADVGLVSYRLYATNPLGKTGVPEPLGFEVVADNRPEPALRINLVVELTREVGPLTTTAATDNPSTTARRRLLASSGSCQPSLRAAERYDIAQRFAQVLSGSSNNTQVINLVSVSTNASNPCMKVLVFSDNRVLSCDDAGSQQTDLKALVQNNSLQEQLGADYQLVTLDFEQSRCSSAVAPRTTDAAVESSPFGSTVVAAVVIGAVVVLLGCVAMFVYRRVSHKKELHLGATFQPRPPTTMDSDRSMSTSEFDRKAPALLDSEPWLFSREPANDFLYDLARPPRFDPGAAVYEEAGTVAPPQYRPPPMYPMDDSRPSDKGGRALDVSAAAAAAAAATEEFGPDSYHTTITTTTTTTRFGGPRPKLTPDTDASASEETPESYDVAQPGPPVYADVVRQMTGSVRYADAKQASDAEAAAADEKKALATSAAPTSSQEPTFYSTASSSQPSSQTSQAQLYDSAGSASLQQNNYDAAGMPPPPPPLPRDTKK